MQKMLTSVEACAARSLIAPPGTPESSISDVSPAPPSRAPSYSCPCDASRHFFVCGVGEIVPRLRGLLRGAGYERRAVPYEKW